MKDDQHKHSTQSFDLEFSKNPITNPTATHSRLLKLEAQFQRTSMIILICYFAFSIYNTVDFCYCLYLIWTSCSQLAILYTFDVISDIIFWISTIMLYMAIKYTSVRRLQNFTYLMISLVLFRLIYAVILLLKQNLISDTECNLTDGDKVWKMVLYLFENFFYVVSIGSVHYMTSILEIIKEAPTKYLNPDIKESLIM